jgi:hypothetical protein
MASPPLSAVGTGGFRRSAGPYIDLWQVRVQPLRPTSSRPRPEFIKSEVLPACPPRPLRGNLVYRGAQHDAPTPVRDTRNGRHFMILSIEEYDEGAPCDPSDAKD